MIDCAIIINLPFHEKRKSDMIEKIKKTNIKRYFFHRAVDGNTELSEHKFKPIPGWFDHFKLRGLTVGEIACALSHYHVWEYIVKNKIPKSLILEDDVEFLEDFNSTYDNVQSIEQHYDLLYIGRNQIHSDREEIQINDFLVKPNSSYNAHSYIITYECAQKLLLANFLNHLLPIDDFLSILYDDDYPYKEYSQFFQKIPKIVAISLKTDITDQSKMYVSSIDFSDLYTRNETDNNSILDNKSEQIDTTTWTINLDSQYSENVDRYNSLLIHFIDFSVKTQVNLSLNLESESFSFIEQFIYENIRFHMNRLKIPEINDKTITFWTKAEEYNFDHIHMHIDHCDYESRVYRTEKKKPLFTSIIYLDDNPCPTLVTDVTRYMVKKSNFNKNNKKMFFSFPKMFKNIVFESGKFYHGESYLSDYNISNRKSIVIAVWNKENKPYYIPYFDKYFFYYYLFFNTKRKIDEKEYDEFKKSDILCTFENRDHTIVNVPIYDHSLVDLDFFHRLIVRREKNILYKFANIFKGIENPDTVILNFTNLVLNKPYYFSMNCFIEHYGITFKTDSKIENELIRDILLINEEVILNIHPHNFSIIEKYIYDISLYHAQLIEESIDDFIITFKCVNNTQDINVFGYEDTSLITCITVLEDSMDPIIISDIDYDSYKYKEFEEKKMCLIQPKKNSQIVFSGGNYHNYNSNKVLVIRFWRKHTALEFKQFNPEIGDKHPSYPIRIKRNVNASPKQIYVGNDVFEELLYNKKVSDELHRVFNNEGSCSVILNIAKPTVLAEKIKKDCKKLSKMKFILK